MEEKLDENSYKKRPSNIARDFSIAFLMGIGYIGSISYKVMLSQSTEWFIFALIVYILAIVFFFIKRRKPIAIGLIIPLILMSMIPLLLIGSCHIGA
jgi:hypothetical protein